MPVDGQQLAEWAARGALTDITEYVEKSGLKQEDFWLPRWQESTFNGRIFALPWGADPNFAMLWNKAAFREAGLDPEKPPRTIAELDAYCEKLTKVDKRGRLTQVGIIPWYGRGDFNYSGSIDGDDYFLIDGAFLGQTSILAPVTPGEQPASSPAFPMLQFKAGAPEPALDPPFFPNASAWSAMPVRQSRLPYPDVPSTPAPRLGRWLFSTKPLLA